MVILHVLSLLYEVSFVCVLVHVWEGNRIYTSDSTAIDYVLRAIATELGIAKVNSFGNEAEF